MLCQPSRYAATLIRLIHKFLNRTVHGRHAKHATTANNNNNNKYRPAAFAAVVAAESGSCFTVALLKRRQSLTVPASNFRT